MGTLNTTTLENTMLGAVQGLAANLWNDIQTYAIPELKKIATQVVAIEEGMLKNPPDFTKEGAKALLSMQVKASVGVIVAMTHLTLLEVQKAINQIIGAIQNIVNTAVHFALI